MELDFLKYMYIMMLILFSVCQTDCSTEYIIITFMFLLCKPLFHECFAIVGGWLEWHPVCKKYALTIPKDEKGSLFVTGLIHRPIKQQKVLFCQPLCKL